MSQSISQSLSHSSPAKATLREWVALAVLALPCLLYSMDLSVLYLAVPALSADLKPSAVELLWIVDIYGFMVAGMLVTMGTLGDRMGRRKVLLWGAVAFALTSILAAFAQSPMQLIIARALLGIAAATLAPSTMSLIRNMFHDEHERAVAIGVWMAAFSAGGALGPVIGGFLIAKFWWGSVFLLAVPVMVLLLIVGPKLLPEYKDDSAGQLDWISAVLSIIMVLLLIYAIKHAALRGVDALTVLSLIASVGLGYVFVQRQKTLADPMIDLSLLTNRMYSGCLAINVMFVFIVFGVFLYVAQYFQSVRGMSAFEAGLWMLPSGLVFASGSIISPLLIRKIRPAVLVAVCFGITTLGFLMLAQVRYGAPLWHFMVGYLVFCVGLTPIGAVTMGIAMTAAPPERAGAASAISETSFELGGAVGIAVLGSFLSAVYAKALRQDAQIGTLGLSAEQLTRATETLGSALDVAMQLPQTGAAALTQAAQISFLHAFTVGAYTCAVIAVGCAWLGWRVLKGQGIPQNTGH